MPPGPLPAVTFTFLFSDIEGSTKLWEAYPSEMADALARHDAILRTAIESAGGQVFKTIGDAFCAAFPSAVGAVEAAISAQVALAAEAWPEPIRIKVRIALHSGEVEFRDGDYFGAPVNRLARLLSIGHGGQVLLSRITYDLVRDSVDQSVHFVGLGEHKLKDLGRPESVYQLVYPNLPSTFPALKSLDNPNLKHNLPRQLTSFVGREKELVEIAEIFGKTRALTLTGAGGCGKTRLALQAAADLVDEVRDGVWLIELAAVSDSALVPQAVAGSLHVKEQPGKSVSEALAAHLARKQAVLVLDNCEHLLSACAVLADALLRSCPELKILATSREGLNFAGETTYRVPSLSLPSPSDNHTPESLSHFEAVRLFIERAVQVQTYFQVTNQNAPAVASVCHQLDGIPLALELAAARVKSLSVEHIESRLDARFRLLTGGSRSALPRQQTLRALIDWSYDLLNDHERLVLNRLSVFNGWRLEAAETVCSGDGIDEFEILDLLTSLVDKSLVIYEADGEVARYRLLETVRRYAWDRLEENGGVETIRARHGEYFRTLAAEANPNLKGPDQGLWYRRLDEELENVRAALEWGRSHDSAKEFLSFCNSLNLYWYNRGLLSEGRDWFAQGLGLAGAEEHIAERADALYGAATLARVQNDFPTAQLGYEESLAIRREIDDRKGIGYALMGLAIIAREKGDYVAAETLWKESAAIYKEIGERGGTSEALGNLGAMASDLGRVDEAIGHYNEALAISKEVGDVAGTAIWLANLGIAYRMQGDYASAKAYSEESLATAREGGFQRIVGLVLGDLGTLAKEQGEFAQARSLLSESLAMYVESGQRRYVAEMLVTFASLCVDQRKPGDAAILAGASERLREEMEQSMPPSEQERYDAEMAGVRRSLGEEAFGEFLARGRAMSLDDAIAFALADSGTSEG